MLFTLRAVHLSCHPQEIGTNGKSESQRSRLLQCGEVRFELNRLRLSPHRMGHWQSMPIRYGVICCVAPAEMQGTVEIVELGAALGGDKGGKRMQVALHTTSKIRFAL